MSSLENKKIKDSYKDLLQISNTNTGIDNTLRSISDGGGTISALKISSSEVSIDGNLEANSITINNKSVATQDWVTSNTSTGALINWTETNGNIIPNSNASFDLGNAEYKVRHLFLSDNSMWLGDEIKLESYAKKKRNRSKLPKWFEVNTPGVTTEEIFNWHNTEFDLENKISSFEEISLFALTEFAKIKIGNSELTSSDIYPSQYNEDGSINDIYDPLDYEYIIDDDQSFKVNSFLSNLNSSNTEERKQKILQIDETGDGIQFVDQELLQGEKGMQGIAGPQGDSGPQGIPGLQGDIGLKGEQGDAFVFSDFTTEQLESLVGEKGNKGETAPRGIDGSDGEKGEKGIQGNPGSQGITGPQGDIGLKGEQGDGFVYSDFTTSQLESLVGEKGDKGDQGIPGLQGDIGLKGDQGIQGDKGDAGDKGDQGIPGLQGDIGLKGDQGIQGEIGPQGLKGDKGDTGDIGLQGDAGQGYTNAQILNGELILTPTLGENVNLGNVIGPQGIQGEQGLSGSRGFTGATGATGPGYVNSSISESGDLILTTTSGENLNLGNVIGPQGIQGIQGEQGLQGEQGIQGIQGEAGNNGQDGVGFLNGTTTGQIYYSGGNVGIGTDNPASGKLHIIGGNHYNEGITLSGRKNDGTSLTTLRFFHDDENYAHIARGSTPSISISAGGNLGIGTTSPTAPLTIVEQSNVALKMLKSSGQTLFTIGEDGGNNVVLDSSTVDSSGNVNANSGDLIIKGKNVGIGTDNPVEKLTVIGDILIDNNMNSTLYLGKGAEGVDGVTKIKCTQTGTDTDELGLSFFVHGSSSGSTLPYEAMSITHTGNVGIGTESPGSKLHILVNNADEYDASSYASAILKIANNNTTATSPHSLIHFRLEKNGGDGYLGFITDGATTNTEHFVLGNQTGGELLRVKNNGNIGIGTTSPNAKLEISGGGTGVWLKTNNITNRSSNTMAGQNYINLTNQLPTDENSFEIGPGYINLNRDDNVPINQLSFGMNGMLSAAFEVGGTTNSDHSLRFKVGQNDSNKAGIERMRISSDGSIGINTTSPSSTFHVVGSATIESSSPLLVLKDTDGGDDVKQTGFISYRDNDNVERGWVGFGSSLNKHFGIRNNIGNMQISASNNVEIYGSCMGLNTSAPSGGGIGGNHFEVKSSSASGIHLNRVNGQGEAVVDFTIYSGSTNFVMYDNKNSADRFIITDAGDTHFAGHVGSQNIGLSYGENTASSLSCMQWKNNYGSGNTSGGALILAHNANASWANAYINSFNYSSGKETRLIQWLINGVGKGSIRHNGSSISYETTSDYRTKKNIVNLNDGLQRVNLLNPIKHEWVDEITDGVFDGFLAHEVQQIVPEAVSGVKDQVTQDNKIVPQSMDACKLIPILTSAIQELSKKVDDLQDQINTLKQN